MRAKLVFFDDAWVEGDFEPPASLRDKPVLTVWRSERSEESGQVAMKVDRGAGIWDASGRLLFHDPQLADLSFAGRRRLHALENRVEDTGRGRHRSHRLQLREDATFGVLEETVMSLPMGALEYLVTSPQGDRCLVTWLDQSQWGYVVAGLPGLAQQPGGLFYPTPSLSPPAISPDGSCAVACSFLQPGWWTDVPDDYWDAPSPGGIRKLGALSVHVFGEPNISWHDLLVRLEPGWLPEDYTDSWDMAWGPGFVDESRIRIWLPDGGEEVLSLPLPPRVVIERPLRRRRGD